MAASKKNSGFIFFLFGPVILKKELFKKLRIDHFYLNKLKSYHHCDDWSTMERAANYVQLNQVAVCFGKLQKPADHLNQIEVFDFLLGNKRLEKVKQLTSKVAAYLLMTLLDNCLKVKLRDESSSLSWRLSLL